MVSGGGGRRRWKSGNIQKKLQKGFLEINGAGGDSGGDRAGLWGGLEWMEPIPGWGVLDSNIKNELLGRGRRRRKKRRWRR